MQYVDYYRTLGVDRAATQEEISRAFKSQARKYHPDLNKGAGAEAKFKEVNEAHEVLKDPETRKRYDTLGASYKHGAPFEPPAGWGGGQSPGAPGSGVRFEFHGQPGGGGFSDFFSAFMGGAGAGGFGRGQGGAGLGLEDLLGGLGGGRGPARAPRGQDVESELTVELEDIYHGRTRSIQLSGHEGTRNYEVKIPRGVRSGERIRLGGQGLNGHGRTPGDLYLTIKLARHPRFSVEGDDLVVEVAVPPWDAALGAKTRVPTLDGEVTMALPAGVSSGQRLRLRGKGLPRKQGVAGDLYAAVKIVVPSSLTDDQRRLFDELRRISEPGGR